MVIPSIGAARHAEKVASWGADAVMIQGGEGGGHTGNVPTTLLLPTVLDAVDIPVIAAGGFFDGRGLAAALSYGAAGIGMGTRFLLTRDSAVPDAVKQLYLSHDLNGTVVTDKVDGMPHRMLRTQLVEELQESSALRRLGPTARRTLAFKRESGLSWAELARDGRAMRKAQGRSLAQMTLAANTPMMLKAGLVDGDTGAGVLALGPGRRRDRRPAELSGARSTRTSVYSSGRRRPHDRVARYGSRGRSADHARLHALTLADRRAWQVRRTARDSDTFVLGAEPRCADPCSAMDSRSALDAPRSTARPMIR